MMVPLKKYSLTKVLFFSKGHEKKPGVILAEIANVVLMASSQGGIRFAVLLAPQIFVIVMFGHALMVLNSNIINTEACVPPIKQSVIPLIFCKVAYSHALLKLLCPLLTFLIWKVT